MSLIVNIKDFLYQYKSVLILAIKAIGAYFLWLLFLSYFPHSVYEVHYQLIHFQTWASANLISMFGFVGSYMTGDQNCLGHLFLNGRPSVCVGTGCSGLDMFVVYIVFLLIVNNGAWKRLVWFLPLGLLLIIAMNIVRIVSLAFIYNFAPKYMEFNHKYTFVLLVYGAIFSLWYFWVNKLTVRSNRGEKK